MGANPSTAAATGHPAASPLGAPAVRLAHDFNNLLTSILGHVSMLQAEPALSRDGQHGLERIRRATDRATALTRELLTLADPRPSARRLGDPVAPWRSSEVGGDETVLLVEDNDDFRALARRALEQQGYAVLDAPDAETAVTLADRHPGHIHLLLTDVVLPGLSGRELAARIGIHRPATKVLYMSGTSDDVIIRHRMLEPGTEFLEKPFSLDHLLRLVRQVLGPPELAPPV